MEIDITDFAMNTGPFNFSHSAFEGGSMAGRNTWNAAKEEAESSPLLTTEEQIDTLRQWAKETGGWNEEECNAWNDEECNALFIQFISEDHTKKNARTDDTTATYIRGPTAAFTTT